MKQIRSTLLWVMVVTVLAGCGSGGGGDGETATQEAAATPTVGVEDVQSSQVKKGFGVRSG